MMAGLNGFLDLITKRVLYPHQPDYDEIILKAFALWSELSTINIRNVFVNKKNCAETVIGKLINDVI